MRNIFLITTLLFSINSYGKEGGTVGNGGDTYAVQFVDIANLILVSIDKNSSTEFKIKELADTIALTLVESTDERLELNGVLKDAINYPLEKRIMFNRDAWNKMTSDRHKMLFVLHEYLGIMKINDSMYDVSGRALRLIFKDSLVCVSIHLAKGNAAVAGTATLQFGSDNDVTWTDGIYDYRVSSSASHLNFTFEYESEIGIGSLVKTHLDPLSPYFDLWLPVKTTKTIGTELVDQIEIECK